MIKPYEPQGATGAADGDALELPENPEAQNAATAALKPKIGAAAATPLPQMGTLNPQAQTATPVQGTNPDPNAYAPPPQGAPMPTLSGDWQAPTASAGSAPLIASAAGGTMTPQGTATNPFAGYQTDQGGGFGGYDTAPLAGDAAGRTFKTYDQDFVKNANALKQVPPLTPAEFQAMTQADNGANAVKDKIAKGQPVSDKELAFVRQARGMELQQDTTAPTFGTFGTKTGTATAADPAAQAAGLASQGLPPIAPVPEGAPVAAPGPLPSAVSAAMPPRVVSTEPDPSGFSDPRGPRSSAPASILPAKQAIQATSDGQTPTASGMGNVAQTPVNTQNTLTNALLARQGGADRFKIAGDQWDAFTKSTAPQYEADQRAAMRKAAAGGALGSGMLQTSLGDLASNRALAMDTQKQNFLSEALKGTIGDQFADVGVAQQQQGFQNSQQQQAFQQAIQKLLTEDQLTGSGFNRALQSLYAGGASNPSDLAQQLSTMFGGQSTGAGQSLSALLAAMAQRPQAGAAAPAAGNSGIDPSLLNMIFGTGQQKPIGAPTYQRPDTLPPVPEDYITGAPPQVNFGGGNY